MHDLDTKLMKIAKNLIDYSLGLEKGNTLSIYCRGADQRILAYYVANYAKSKGIRVIRDIYEDHYRFKRFWEGATQEQIDAVIKEDIEIAEQTDGFFRIIGDTSVSLSEEGRRKYGRYRTEVLANHVWNRRWCLTELPNRNVVERNGINYEEMLEMYLDSCSINYKYMSKAADVLVDCMKKAEKVRIIAPGTDLSFSIKGLPAVKCVGQRNFPDGEVFTAPVKDSVNGTISYNVGSIDNGILHKDIKFIFKDGRIVKATSNHTEKLNATLDSDDGARYIGEFALGINPVITKPRNNILYDEKISGSMHFTPGNAYLNCDNGNKSAIHWDLVQIQTSEYGGGEIWFDDVLIRKDGLFIPKALQILNPNNLLYKTSLEKKPESPRSSEDKKVKSNEIDFQ